MNRTNSTILVTTLGVLILSIVLFSIGMTSLIFIDHQHLVISYFYILAFFMPVCFVGLPHYLAQKYKLYSRYKEVTFSTRVAAILLLLLFVGNAMFIKGNEFWHQMIVASCEEYLFRYVLYRMLRKNFSTFHSILFCSLAFGILLHLNYNLWDNLLIRTPVGVLLGYIATHLGLHYSIAAHWLINLLAALF